MPEALILTGNTGVGKSTIAAAWADARGGAALHADDMRWWIRDPAVRRARDYQEAFTVAVALFAAHQLVGQQLSVALDNVWMPAAVLRLHASLASLLPTRVVRLTCERPVNHDRDAQRPIGCMGGRVDTLGDALDALEWPPCVATLDSTGLSVTETLSRIDRLPPNWSGISVS